MKVNLRKMYGFETFKDWHSSFDLQTGSYGDIPRLGLDPRIRILSEKINLSGLRILELGSLEGLHSLMVHELGAKEIISIEGKKDNFLKCLIVKNFFKLDRCSFMLGDIAKILPTFCEPFDLCLALGILYHFPDPISVIYRLGQIAENLFAWTHYSNDISPRGRIKEICYAGNSYRGKYIKEDLKDKLSGLSKFSFFVLEDDIPRLLNDAGFSQVEIIHKENTPHGPAVTFFAKK